jgi:hypothetical protein
VLLLLTQLCPPLPGAAAIVLRDKLSKIIFCPLVSVLHKLVAR